MTVKEARSFFTIFQFLNYSKKWRPKILLATFYSIINKLFDIAPEILIGFAVDLVVKKQSSFIASLGFVDPKSQLTMLGICTFLIWAFESLFQYMYSITWRNIAQSVEHEIRLDAYTHVQSLDMQWYDKQKTGNIAAILNDDVNQLERFLDNGANEIIQISAKTGLGVNYSKDIGPGTFTMGGDINPDGTFNTEAKYGITFANGGLASIL